MNLSKNSIRSIFWLTLGILAASSAVLSAETVNIPDANLASAVRKQLGLDTSEAITKEAMSGLYTLKANGTSVVATKITDLAGIEHATNLRYLDLSDNAITDVTLLANLTELVYLDLTFNSDLKDASPLGSLFKLNTLGLGGTKVKNLAFLSNIATQQQANPQYALQRLYIGKVEIDTNEYGITDVSPVAQLSSLSFLSAENNRIASLAPLASLINEKKSLKQLILFGNYINSISPIIPADGEVSTLARLSLEGNYLTDIRGLTPEKFPELDILAVGGNFLDVSDDSETRKILKQFEDIDYVTVNYSEQRTDIWAHLPTSGANNDQYREVKNRAFFPDNDEQVVFKSAPHFKWSQTFGFIYFANEKQTGSAMFAYFFDYSELGWTWIQMDLLREGYVFSFDSSSWVSLYQ